MVNYFDWDTFDLFKVLEIIFFIEKWAYGSMGPHGGVLEQKLTKRSDVTNTNYKMSGCWSE